MPLAFERFAKTVADIVPVRLIAGDRHADYAKKHLGQHKNIDLVSIETNDCWIRDYGPTFVHDASDGQVLGVDWQFNAWGGKYPPWDLDAAVAKKILTHCGLGRLFSKLTLEGGAIETDGLGTVILTASTVIGEARNPGWTKVDVESELSRLLGATEFVWLDSQGLIGDDTDGHVDQLVRFTDPANLLVATCEDPDDPNHEPLEGNFRFLSQWASDQKRQIDVHRLPIPPAREIEGQRVPESYCNFLIAGDCLVVPKFQSESDASAVARLCEIAPSRNVIGVDASDLSWGLGAFHCLSQQQPMPWKRPS